MGCSSCKSKNRQNKNSKKVQDVTFENVEGGKNSKSSNVDNDQVKDFLGSVTQMAPKKLFLKVNNFFCNNSCITAFIGLSNITYFRFIFLY